MEIRKALEYLAITLKAAARIDDGDEVVIYVPPEVYNKLEFELSKIQRYSDPSEVGRDVGEISICDMLRIRREHELRFLETTIEKIRRMVA